MELNHLYIDYLFVEGQVQYLSHAHTHTHTHTHVYTHTCIYTHTHTHMHSHMYTHAYTHTHTHIHTQSMMKLTVKNADTTNVIDALMKIATSVCPLCTFGHTDI